MVFRLEGPVLPSCVRDIKGLSELLKPVSKGKCIKKNAQNVKPKAENKKVWCNHVGGEWACDLHCHWHSSATYTSGATKPALHDCEGTRALPAVHFLVVLMSRRPAFQQQPSSLAKTRSKTKERQSKHREQPGQVHFEVQASHAVPIESPSWTKHNLILHSVWVKRIMIRCTAPHTWSVMVGECQTKQLCSNTGSICCLESRGQALLGEKSNQALKSCILCKCLFCSRRATGTSSQCPRDTGLPSQLRCAG